MYSYDLVAHLKRQRAFSLQAYGPHPRIDGIIDHIKEELVELEAEPNKQALLYEWMDVVLLALDGAWRSGFTPEEVAAALEAKQAKNERREWPDWRTLPTNVVIEHVRGKED